MPVTIKFRRGTSSSWTSNGNIILASGEPGYELDTGRFKIGNGSTIWNNLPYATVVPSGFLAGSGISLNLANNGASLTINSSGATISNYGDNRVLTSDGTTTGINGESNLTFNGSLLNINGNLAAITGNFTALRVANIPVSVSGHTHTSANITDFNDAVSGLLPVKQIVAGTGIVVSSNNGIYTIVSNGSGVLADRASALVTTVFNKTPNTINKGSVVYVNGGQGDQPTIDLAIANGETGSSKTYGITAENIASMSLGRVVVAGALTGLNTDQYNPSAPQGDINGVTLYLSPSTSGAMTTIKPYAPDHLVSVGTVVRTHQNEGVIEVRIQNGFELEELHNVAVTGATNGQFLQYNSSSGLWLPSSSGNFTTLLVNGTGVSVSGHTHLASEITNFNPAVSGLISGIYAPLISPALTGTPLAPTAPGGTNTNQIATTSFVRTEISNLVDSAPTTLDTLNELAAALGDDPNFATTVTNNLSTKVSATGTINYIPKFSGPQTIVNSIIYESGNNIGIGTTTPDAKLVISGDSYTTGKLGVGSACRSTLSADLGSAVGLAWSESSFIGMQFQNTDAYRMGIVGVAAARETRILSKAADNAGIITFYPGSGTAEAGRFHSNGRFAVGTTSPMASLHVVGTGLFTNVDIGTSAISGQSALTVNGGITTQGSFVRTSAFSIYGDSLTQIYKPDGSTLGYAVANSGYRHVFGFNNGGTHTPWITIDRTGLGIGTSNPTATLDVLGTVRVSGTTSTALEMYDNGTSSYSSLVMNGNDFTINSKHVVAGFSVGVRGNRGTNVGMESNGANGYLALAAGGSERVRITTSGWTGIGTTAPSYHLHVIGTGNFSQNLLVNGTGVSLVGHSHSSANITDFNSSVSGLLPVKDIVAGTGIVISSNSGIYTIDSTVSAGTSTEAASLVTNVFNKTASTINKGRVVYINGGQGDQPTIQLAIAANESGSSKTYGIVQDDIPSMSLGKVVVAGTLTGFNTDQFNPTAPQGDVNGVTLWLSPTISGAMTTTKPSAPNHLVSVGTIVRTHQNEGVVEVRIQNGFELEELHNVAITGALNGQFLQYNSVSGLWLPSSSGNFTTLQVNNTGVSVSGHYHISSDITDFNISVSGLLPTISNSGNNRILTSTGSSVGINAESNLTFDNGAFTVGENHYNVGIFSTIAGGIDNKIYGINSFIGAGYQNIITSGNYSSVYNVITGGQNNQIVFGDRSFIGGGSSGIINGFNNVLMGGFANSISGNNSIICGGANNTITGGEFVTIVGGSANNNAGYNNVFILGSNITATQPNTTYVQNIIGQSGNFINLTVNNSGIALSGHTHTSSNIIDFNSSVSGLFPPNIATGVGISGYLTRWNGINTISTGIMYDNGTKIGIGTKTPSELLDVSGTISANQFISKRDNNIIAGSGQIVLDGANGNRIDFNNNGIGPPSFTTNRSVGTKIVLAPNTSSTQTEYALGIEAGAMWFSIPVAASRAFQWYAGTANIATLFGNGTLDIKGNTSQINVDDLRLDNNVLSITTANSDLILKPNGNGSLVADTSGNLRGIYSNDFQRERTSPSGVASGSYSVICGGSDNRATGSYSIICGGQANTSTNTFTSVGGGDLNNATGNRSVVCGGGSNTSSAQSSVVGGGSSNQATGVYSIVPGGFRAKATRQGELSHAGGFFNAAGDAQHTILIARRLTTDATADVVLTLNGLAPASTNILSIPAQTMWTFSIKLSAYNVTNNESGWWIFRGGIRRNNANSTVLVGSLITESGVESTLSTASATVVADDINEALEIRVTGVAAKNIRWVAVADISQVSYGTP